MHAMSAFHDSYLLCVTLVFIAQRATFRDGNINSKGISIFMQGKSCQYCPEIKMSLGCCSELYITEKKTSNSTLHATEYYEIIGLNIDLLNFAIKCDAACI